MIKKAGILEVIPFKESLEDIGGLAKLLNIPRLRLDMGCLLGKYVWEEVY